MDQLNILLSTFESTVAAFKELENNQNNDLKLFESSLPLFTNEVNKIIVRNEERRKVTKERFNVFSCLTKYHLEELHSNFIYYLLNPKSQHDCDALFLKLFFDSIKNIEDIGRQFSTISSQEFNTATVHKEWAIGRSLKSDIYGNIDIFIESNNYVIAIENKIYAHEQKDQISRYSKYCNEYCEANGKTAIVLYLTIDGKESTQHSSEKYYPISYQLHINNWLENSIKESWQYPLVYAGIYYYKELINKHILNKPSNNILMDIKELMLKKENLLILKYLPLMASSIVPIRIKLRLEFFYKVFDILKTEGYTVVPVQKIYNENVSLADTFKDNYRGIVIKDENISTSIDDQMLTFSIEHDYPELYFGLFGKFTTANGEKIIIKSLRDKLPKFILDENEYWPCWKTFKYLDKNFDDDNLNYDFATNMDVIVSNFMVELREFLAAWNETVTSLKTTEVLD